MAGGVRIETGRAEFDGMAPLVRGFLERDRMDVVIDGERIRGYRSPDARSIWIRDLSDMMRATRYFEEDMRSAVEHFAATQAASGRIFDYFTTFPEKLPSERENWTKYVRVPVEADVEYRFVKAAWLAWQATGDEAWIRRLIPAMERALEYGRSHPWRWDAELGLVKRAYTIDTWDFAYTAGQHDWLQFQIDDRTFWGIFHGDNSGTIEAYRILGALRDRIGDAEHAALWHRRAADLQEVLERICWNGRFFTHFVKRTPVEVPGVDEGEQLSLSNPMAINRGAASLEMAESILEEYQRRRESTGTFAEWFSIDPPFPDGIFGDRKLVGGAYVNGGILPLVGGEIARAAFDSGFESYGVDILRRYWELAGRTGESYLWYFPDGRPATVETSTSPEAQPTDGWGSSAMLYALVEGLAGVVDRGCALDRVLCQPRWPAAGIAEARVEVGYAASGASFDYAYRSSGKRIRIEVRAAEAEVGFHVLLPAGARATSVTVGGREVTARRVLVRQSTYADFEAHIEGGAVVEIGLAADD